jgi:hypothetical protein
MTDTQVWILLIELLPVALAAVVYVLRGIK